MARTKTVIDQVTLTEKLKELEGDGTKFSSYNELFTALAATEWATTNKFSANVLRSRTIDYKIELKTPVGKRGRKPAAQKDTPVEA